MADLIKRVRGRRDILAIGEVVLLPMQMRKQIGDLGVITSLGGTSKRNEQIYWVKVKFQSNGEETEVPFEHFELWI